MRPSSEALLRRLKKGEPLPRINSLVDVANALSVQLQVPVGLYDLGKVQGDELVVRLGAEGESYTGIGKERVNVAGRICVADAEGADRQPELRLGADDDHDRHGACGVDLLPAGRATRPSIARRS